MHLTTDCPRGWYFNPKYAAWLEAAGEAQSNECLCQQPRRPTEEEIIAAGHPALNSRNYKSHAASGLKALGSFVSCPLSHLTFDCWSNSKKKKMDFLKSKASRDWMPVHNLHCSQAHQLWGLSTARIRPGETTLRPLCSLTAIFFLKALCHLTVLGGFLLPPDEELLRSSTWWCLPRLPTAPLVGICWRIH